jgi:hypothetical protein
MQRNSALSVDLKFILVTEELSFIPDNIKNCCEVVHIGRPTKAAYNKCIGIKLSVRPEQITNIKNLKSDICELMMPHKIICDKIISAMIDIDDIKFLKFRDLLYDIFIYNLDITDCVWYIVSTLMMQKRVTSDDMSTALNKTYSFFQYYNNNYRPIYHLEHFLFTIVSIIHQYKP